MPQNPVVRLIAAVALLYLGIAAANYAGRLFS